jgi:hypothetical protein
MQPGFDEDEEMRDQEAASILLLRVALRLLGEKARRERLHAEWEARTERIRQFTATRFVRALPARLGPADPRGPPL